MAKASFDILWSEGALYFMGFENGLEECFKVRQTRRLYCRSLTVAGLEDAVPEGTA